MIPVRSLALFVVAAFFEIGGAWLVWQGVREHRGWLWVLGGVIALGAYAKGSDKELDAALLRMPRIGGTTCPRRSEGEGRDEQTREAGRSLRQPG